MERCKAFADEMASLRTELRDGDWSGVSQFGRAGEGIVRDVIAKRLDAALARWEGVAGG